MCWNLFFEEMVVFLIEVPQSNIFVTKCSSRHRYQRVLVPCFNVKPSCFPGFPYKVGCSATEMRVEMAKPADVKRVYLEHLKNYPGEHGLEVSRYSLAWASIEGTFRLGTGLGVSCAVKILFAYTKDTLCVSESLETVSESPTRISCICRTALPVCDSVGGNNHESWFDSRWAVSAKNREWEDYVQHQSERHLSVRRPKGGR